MRVSTTPDLHEVARAIRPLLPEGCRAVLFGSRAKGVGRPRSDWDIGLIGPAPVGGAVLERLREELDSLRTLHSFDVVDLATVPAGFRQLALETAVPIE